MIKTSDIGRVKDDVSVPIDRHLENDNEKDSDSTDVETAATGSHHHHKGDSDSHLTGRKADRAVNCARTTVVLYLLGAAALLGGLSWYYVSSQDVKNFDAEVRTFLSRPCRRLCD